MTATRPSPALARRPPWRAAWALVALVGGVSGCGAQAVHVPGCSADTQCPSDSVCMVGICLPRGMDRTVAVEILPRTDSPAARTGIANVVLGPTQIALAADERVMVEGTVTNAPNAHVLVLVPNPIPGDADLQFETDLANFKFQTSLGSRLLHSMATIWLNPNVNDPLQAPVPFTTMLDASLTFTFPTADQMTVLRGALRDSQDMPAAPFLVRALLDNNVISNVATTDAAGMYQLLIAPGAVPAARPQMVIIDFTPMNPDSGPRFQTAPIPLGSPGSSAPPRMFRMPAFQSPQSFPFVVQSSDRGAQPLTDVTIRFRTEIPAASTGPVDVANPLPLGSGGMAIYEREARTDAKGRVGVLLIPGTDSEPLNYQITIVPPPASPYASKCIPQHPVTVALSGSDGEPAFPNTFSLDPKVTLRGTVLASDGTAAATVSVMATPLSGNVGCPGPIASSQVSATTAHNGAYQMLVDPGTYRLDIDPAAGAPIPRLTEDAVGVPGDPATYHDVTLPAGEVMEGDLWGVDKMPLGLTSLRISQVQCQADSCAGPGRIPPALLAQTRTDMRGHFRAVLPAP